MIDVDLNKKIRDLQSKGIFKTTKSVRFSRIINDVLRKGLR